MTIWKSSFDIDKLNKFNANTAAAHLGIEFVNFGDDWLVARMPVDHRSLQPFGIVHGGASVLLAETVGSVASCMCVDLEKYNCFGLDINANHIRAVRDGYVFCEARPFHLGRSTHVWDLRISDTAGRLTCVARLTMSIMPRS